MNKITYNYKDKTDLTWYDIKKLFPNVSFPDEDLVKTETLANLGITKQETEAIIPLADFKNIKITELKSARDAAEVATINNFDFDDKSRDRLDIAYKALSASNSTIEWTMADNTTAIISATDINNVFIASATRSNELHEKYRTLKAEVNACTTKTDVEKITW